MRNESGILQELYAKILILSILQKYIFREWFWTALAVSIVLVSRFAGCLSGRYAQGYRRGTDTGGSDGYPIAAAFARNDGQYFAIGRFCRGHVGPGPFLPRPGNGGHALERFRLAKSFKATVEPRDCRMAVALLLLGLVGCPDAVHGWPKNNWKKHFVRPPSGACRQASSMCSNRVTWCCMPKPSMRMAVRLKIFSSSSASNDREQVWVAQKGRYWMDTDTGDRYLCSKTAR